MEAGRGWRSFALCSCGQGVGKGCALILPLFGVGGGERAKGGEGKKTVPAVTIREEDAVGRKGAWGEVSWGLIYGKEAGPSGKCSISGILVSAHRPSEARKIMR